MAEDKSAEEKSSQEKLDLLAERLTYLESVVREQVARMYALEQRLGIRYQPPPLEPARQPAPPKPAPQTPPVERPPITPPAGAAPQAPPRPPAEAPQAPPPNFATAAGQMRQAAPRPRGDLEARIGGNWFNRIGILAIAFGIAFFLKYAFDNEWIGPAGRVMIGGLIGAGFLGLGERLRRRGYPSYGSGLSGGGILILYLSIFAAYAFYALMPQPVAFILMAGVTIVAALLAARYDALPIAMLGLIGGFLTPILLSTGEDRPVGLFGYILLLDAGVLGLAYRKQWRLLNYLAFAGTAMMMTAWLGFSYTEEKLATAMLFLTLFFILFALLAVLYNIVNCQPTRWADLALVFLNALYYFGNAYDVLEDRHYGVLGLFSVLMAAFYFGLGYVAYRRDTDDRLLIYTFLGLAALFFVLAVPIQFDQHWVTMAWAVEGAILTWVGARLRDKTAQMAAFVVFLIAGAHWLLVDVMAPTLFAGDPFTPLLNRRGLSAAVLIAMLALAGRSIRRAAPEGGEQGGENQALQALYGLGAHGVALVLLTIDAYQYFDRLQAADARWVEARRSMLESFKQLTVTAIWAIYGAILLVFGLARRLVWLRAAGLVLLGGATVKTVMVDSTFYAEPWRAAILNPTFAAYLLTVAALAGGALFYWKAEGIDASERRVMTPLLGVAANAMAVLALSLEAFGYFEARMAALDYDYQATRDLRLAQQLSLSVIWTVYGGALLVIGILRRHLLLRVSALALLGLTIVKVFLIDLAALDRIYRIISFIVLGAILLAVSFLYQRARQRETKNSGEWGVGSGE